MKVPSLRQYACYLMVSLMMMTGVSAQAAMVGTGEIAAGVASELSRDDIKSLLSREDVAQRLTSMGVDTAVVMDRVDAMTDAEVAQLHEQMDNLPAGAGALGTIALVLLILILLDVAGVTDIFPRV